MGSFCILLAQFSEKSAFLNVWQELRKVAQLQSQWKTHDWKSVSNKYEINQKKARFQLYQLSKLPGRFHRRLQKIDNLFLHFKKGIRCHMCYNKCPHTEQILPLDWILNRQFIFYTSRHSARYGGVCAIGKSWPPISLYDTEGYYWWCSSLKYIRLAGNIFNLIWRADTVHQKDLTLQVWTPPI